MVAHDWLFAMTFETEIEVWKLSLPSMEALEHRPDSGDGEWIQATVASVVPEADRTAAKSISLRADLSII